MDLLYLLYFRREMALQPLQRHRPPRLRVVILKN